MAEYHRIIEMDKEILEALISKNLEAYFTEFNTRKKTSKVSMLFKDSDNYNIVEKILCAYLLGRNTPLISKYIKSLNNIFITLESKPHIDDNIKKETIEMIIELTVNDEKFQS